MTPHIFVRSYPRSAALALDVKDDHLRVDLDPYSEADQQWILALADHYGRLSVYDLKGNPVYPTGSQMGSPEGWLSFFQLARRHEQERQDANQKAEQEHIRSLQQKLERFEGLDDSGLLSRSDDFQQFVQFNGKAVERAGLQDSLEGLKARMKRLGEAWYGTFDQQNRQWVNTHGSMELRGALQASEGQRFLVHPLNEMPTGWAALDDEMLVEGALYHRYLSERLLQEHPEGCFLPFLDVEVSPHPQPPVALAEQARQVGGEVVVFHGAADPEDDEWNWHEQAGLSGAAGVLVRHPLGIVVYLDRDTLGLGADEHHVALHHAGRNEKPLYLHFKVEDLQARLTGSPLQLLEVLQVEEGRVNFHVYLEAHVQKDLLLSYRYRVIGQGEEGQQHCQTGLFPASTLQQMRTEARVEGGTEDVHLGDVQAQP